jgi:hypothetical protein
VTPASERSQLARRPPVGPDAALRRKAYQVWLAVPSGARMVRLAAADPAAVGWAVRVHPLAVILALLVAAPLFGLLGMVLAVPVAAAVKILAGHWWASRTLRTEQQLGAVSGPSQASNGDPLPRSIPCRQPENLPGGHR